MSVEPTPAPASHSSTLLSMVRASHPEPTVAVTILVVLLAVAAHVPASTIPVLAVAVLGGQLSVGWSNDLIDVGRDRAVGRADKPFAAGTVDLRVVRWSIAGALGVAVVASFAVGLWPGALHLVLVAWGWAYNLIFKRTVASWLPYAVCFGLMPVVVALAAPDHSWPPAWMVAAGALLGVGAHLLNAVPDLDDDRRTGVRGLPHLLGSRRSLDLATILMLAGSATTVLGPAGPVDGWGLATVAAVVVLAAAGRLHAGLSPFRAALVIAGLNVLALLLRS